MKKLKYALVLALSLQSTPVFASGDVLLVLALFLELLMVVPLGISLFVIKLNGTGKLIFGATTVLAILLALIGTGAVADIEDRGLILFWIFWSPLVIAFICYFALIKRYKKN